MSSSPPGFTKFGRHSLRYPESLRAVGAQQQPGSRPPSAAAGFNLAKPPFSGLHSRGRKSARMHKRLANLFKRSKETDNGGMRLHPAFIDDYIDGRSSSPDPSFRQRSSSSSGKNVFKIFPAKRGNGEDDELSFLWKPCKSKVWSLDECLLCEMQEKGIRKWERPRREMFVGNIEWERAVDVLEFTTDSTHWVMFVVPLSYQLHLITSFCTLREAASGRVCMATIWHYRV